MPVREMPPTPEPVPHAAPVVIPTPVVPEPGDTIEDMTYDERGRLKLKLKGGRELTVRIAGTSTVVQQNVASVGSSVPTRMQDDLDVADYTQLLFHRRIRVGEHRIIIGQEAALVGV